MKLLIWTRIIIDVVAAPDVLRECETFCCAAEFSGPDREHASFNDNIDNNISAPGVDNTNYSSEPGVEDSNHVADTVVSVTQARAITIVNFLRERGRQALWSIVLCKPCRNCVDIV